MLPTADEGLWEDLAEFGGRSPPRGGRATAHGKNCQRRRELRRWRPWYPGNTVTDKRGRDVRATDDGMVPRFHAAHPVLSDAPLGAVEPTREVLLAVAGKHESRVGDHLQQQAAELAEQLRLRQRDLARWESALNARSAIEDDQQRSIRLWQREQQQDFAGKEAELTRRQALLDQQAAHFQAVGLTADALAHRGEQLDQRQQQLEQTERDLQRQAEQLREQAAELAKQRRNDETQLRAQQRTLEQERRQLQVEAATTQSLNEQLRHQIEEQRQTSAARERWTAVAAELEQLRAVLQERETWLLRDRHAWELEKTRWQQRTLGQRQAIAQSWRVRRQTFQWQQKTLRERREQLAQRQQTLDQLQTELRGEQRELLEQRLAMKLARGGLPHDLIPAELAALRQCLREHVDQQLTALESTQQQQRRELQQLATTLANQQKSLTSRQEAMQRWTRDQQRQFDAQAAELEAREQDLEQLHQQFLHDKQAWLRTLDEECSAAINKASCE
ncbi:MAG: hypothetical protein ACYC4N_19720 [Pirellulaceae bacterium]